MSDLACPYGSGSQASPEAPTDLRPSGFDPSRSPDQVDQGGPVAWAGLKLCPEEGSNDDLCSFPSCTCAHKRLPCPPPGVENIPVSISYEDIVRRLYNALPDLTQDEAQCVAEAAFPELLCEGTTIAPVTSRPTLEREQIAKALYEHDTSEPRFLWPIQNARMAANYRSRADAILALIQALDTSSAPQGIEARSDETQSGSAVGESPVGRESDAP